MNDNNTMEIRMERINKLAEILYEMLYNSPQAQVLAEIILETSTTTAA